MEELTLCKHCKSCVEGKCTDTFEPGVVHACVNYLEGKENVDKSNNVQC